MGLSRLGAWLTERVDRLKLRHKLALAILGNIAVVLLVFSLIIDHYHEDRLLQNLEEKNRSLAKSLGSEAVDGLLTRDYLQLDILVSSSQEAILANFAAVVDAQGTVVAHTEKSRLGSRRQLPDSRELVTKDRERDGLVLREYIVPVAIKGELLGHAVLGVNKYKEASLVARDLGRLRTNLLWVSGLLFLLGAVSSSFLSGVLTRRIQSLKEKMNQVQQGNLEVAGPEEPEQACSDLLGCRRHECPAFGGGRQCWTLETTPAGSDRDCLSCAVYKQACGDEIGELNLAFDQMVAELRQSIAKLEETTLEKSRLERLSMLGQMAAQVAHEIKNPLNAIKGSAHYLRDTFQGEMLQEFLGVIEKECERLSDIVSNFLNFSKPGPTVMQLWDLNETAGETVRLVESEAQDKGVRLDFAPDERLGALRFDASKMKQSLLNLVVNAVEASEPGGTVRVATELCKGEVCIAVRDDGPGISPGDRENLFKPFYTTKVRGSGLGLAIAEQNVREHEGRIEVASAEGAGTCFTIIIPWMDQ